MSSGSYCLSSSPLALASPDALAPSFVSRDREPDAPAWFWPKAAAAIAVAKSPALHPTNRFFVIVLTRIKEVQLTRSCLAAGRQFEAHQHHEPFGVFAEDSRLDT